MEWRQLDKAVIVLVATWRLHHDITDWTMELPSGQVTNDCQFQSSLGACRRWDMC